MPATNFTPILLYRSGTTTNQPTAGNLNQGELAINYADGRLFYKDAAGTPAIQIIGARFGANKTTGETIGAAFGTATGVTGNPGNFVFSAAPSFTGDISTTGTFSATKLIPTGNVTAGNGMYLPTTNTLAFSTDGSERMRIDSSGNVGIGTSSPAYLLDINNASSYTTIGLRQGGTLRGYVEGGNSAVKLGTNGSVPILFEINGTERMRIDSSGNVGIGDSSPGYKLTVATTTLIYTDSVNSNNYSLSNGGTNYGGGVAPYLTVAGAGGSYGYLLIKGGDGGTSNTANMAFANKNSAGNYILGALIACNVTTATAGSEVQAFRIALNSGGTVTDRMRINADGTIKTSATISVGDATPSTSGAGITFPATQSASTDANTLDDYEEGTWTPAYVFSTSGSVTYSANGQIGKYTKIGNLVTVKCLLLVATKSSPTGNVTISGLPFTPLNNDDGAGGSIGSIRDFLTITQLRVRTNINFTSIYTETNAPNTSLSALQGSNLDNGCRLEFSITYMTA